MKIYILYFRGQREYISSDLEDITTKYCIRDNADWFCAYQSMKNSLAEKGFWTSTFYYITEREYEAF